MASSEQQRPTVQQSHNQSQPSISPAQQVTQMQQLQPQGHLQGQVLPQQQVQQPSLSSVSVSDIFHFHVDIMLIAFCNCSIRHMELQVIKMFR